MMNLAADYMGTGHLDKAILMGEEALMLVKAKLGPNHLQTAECMNELGAFNQNAGQFEQAISWHQQALAIKRIKLGPNHPST